MHSCSNSYWVYHTQKGGCISTRIIQHYDSSSFDLCLKFYGRNRHIITAHYQTFENKMWWSLPAAITKWHCTTVYRSTWASCGAMLKYSRKLFMNFIASPNSLLSTYRCYLAQRWYLPCLDYPYQSMMHLLSIALLFAAVNKWKIPWHKIEVTHT